MSQPGAMLYTQGFGARPEGVEVPHIDVRDPTSADVGPPYPLGKHWLNKLSGVEWVLGNFTTSNGLVSANWGANGSASALDTITTQDSTVVMPSSGNINLSGATNQLTTSGSGSTATISLVNAITTPGSLTTTTTLTSGGALTVTTGGASITGTTGINTTGSAVTTIGTGGTGATHIGNATGNTAITGSATASTTLTATLGAITATNGNLVLGTEGNKIISTSVASSGTAGANSFGTATLSSGTITISTSAVTSSSIFILTRQAVGASTGLGELTVGTVMAGVSFVIFAGTPGTPGTPLATDASVVGWMLIN